MPSPAKSTSGSRGARALGAILLAAVAVIHAIDLPSKTDGPGYIVGLYIALIAGCVALAGAILLLGRREAWAGAAAMLTLVILGYVASRTVGLPSATDDIGNWGETLGVLSLVVEVGFLLTAASVLRSRAGAAAPAVARSRVASPSL